MASQAENQRTATATAQAPTITANQPTQEQREAQANAAPGVQNIHNTAAQRLAAARVRANNRVRRKKPAPRRPMTSYMAFVRDHYRRMDKPMGNQVHFYGAQMGRVWRSLTANQKAPYERTAITDRIQWEREKRQWREKIGPKRPISAYAYFVRHEFQRLDRVKGQDARGYGKELGRRWQALPINDRTRYYAMARQDLMRFIREKCDWITRAAYRR